MKYLPKAFQTQVRRARKRAAECINQYNISDSSSCLFLKCDGHHVWTLLFSIILFMAGTIPAYADFYVESPAQLTVTKPVTSPTHSTIHKHTEKKTIHRAHKAKKRIVHGHGTKHLAVANKPEAKKPSAISTHKRKKNTQRQVVKTQPVKAAPSIAKAKATSAKPTASDSTKSRANDITRNTAEELSTYLLSSATNKATEQGAVQKAQEKSLTSTTPVTTTKKIINPVSVKKVQHTVVQQTTKTISKSSTPTLKKTTTHKQVVSKHKLTHHVSQQTVDGLPTRLESDPSLHHYHSQGLSVTLQDGTLQENISRIAREAGWSKVVWKVPFDYNWLGTETISGNDLQDIFAKILADYPLQAVFYDANHVVVIVARNSQ